MMMMLMSVSLVGMYVQARNVTRIQSTYCIQLLGEHAHGSEFIYKLLYLKPDTNHIVSISKQWLHFLYMLLSSSL